jgi:hypothetical protein
MFSHKNFVYIIRFVYIILLLKVVGEVSEAS